MLAQNYTTTEVAGFLPCSVEVVKRLVDSGELVGWLVPPARQDRRIPAKSLARYLAANPQYLALLKDGTVRPRKVGADEVAAIVAEADRLAAKRPALATA